MRVSTTTWMVQSVPLPTSSGGPVEEVHLKPDGVSAGVGSITTWNGLRSMYCRARASLATIRWISSGVAGRVLDQTGAVLPGATIDLVADSQRFTTTSDETGGYRFDRVPVGDVELTFQRLLDPKVHAESTRASLAPFIASHRALSPHRFQIVCKTPSFLFLQALSALMILPAHRMSRGDLNTHPLLRRPIGTGPYRFVEWQSRRHITFARFDGYWGTRPAIARIVWRVVSSPDLAVKLAPLIGEAHS